MNLTAANIFIDITVNELFSCNHLKKKLLLLDNKFNKTALLSFEAFIWLFSDE